MKIKIGTRGSPLAMAQAAWVAQQLKKQEPMLDIAIVPITTSGDRDQQSSLTAMGGKGVFVKELEAALFEKAIDVAVHSLKDVPHTLPEGLVLAPFCKREDARDAVVSRFGELLRELPARSQIGTSALRRKAQISEKYAKRRYSFVELRGNVDTRLRKLKEGAVDAIVVALAGLKRLGLEEEVTEILELSDMLPAPAQGCLGFEIREGEKPLLDILALLKDEVSDITARAERAFLKKLGGNCLLPVGAVSKIEGETLSMQGLLFDDQGEHPRRAEAKGEAQFPEVLGAALASQLLATTSPSEG